MSLFGARTGERAKPNPVPDAAQGDYSCFVREIRFWHGPRAGESETLEGGDLELVVITPKHLLWEYQDANSVHNGQPLELDYMPRGLDQLVARREDGSLILRIALDPAAEHTPFTALSTHAVLSGVCYFRPEGT